MTPCAQGRCATRLRYAPTCLLMNFILTDFLNAWIQGQDLVVVQFDQGFIACAMNVCLKARNSQANR